MKSTLLTMPWWHWVTIIVVTTGAICFILWFVVKLRARFKFGNVEIGGQDIPKDGRSPHASCVNKYSLAAIIKKIIDWTIVEHDIRTRGILGAQMVKAEEYVLAIKDQSITWFIDILRKRLREQSIKEPAIHHADYLHFRLVMQEFSVKLKDMVRAACINNGFPTMNDSRYKEYIDDMNKRIGAYASRFFEENYIGIIVRIDDMKSEQAVHFYTQLGEIVRDMFESMKRIAVDKQVEMADMLIKKQDFIEGKLGINDF